MLANLLPGLRDLRNPLTAGALLLASLYVVLASSVQEVRDDGRVIRKESHQTGDQLVSTTYATSGKEGGQGRREG